MDVYTDTIRDLPAVDKLRLVERIWDDLAANEGSSASSTATPLDLSPTSQHKK